MGNQREERRRPLTAYESAAAIAGWLQNGGYGQAAIAAAGRAVTYGLLAVADEIHGLRADLATTRHAADVDPDGLDLPTMDGGLG